MKLLAKPKQYFECESCGYKSAKWLGQCPTCRSWESLTLVTAVATGSVVPSGRPNIQTYGSIAGESANRFTSGSSELDRVLGGGFVPGSINLIGGDPGIGKSTLMLQIAANLQKSGHSVLYVSGEESLSQIKLRGERLGLDAPDLTLLAETSQEVVEQIIEDQGFKVLFVDSIQTMYLAEISSGPGSVTQVREITSRLMTICKRKSVTAVLIGHITKSGSLAGPKTLEHIVDGVFYFEGDQYNDLRLVRAQKNRFGPAQELGIYQMSADGLHEVANPSQILLAQRPEGSAGSVVVPCIQGTRPIMVEIQVLLSTSTYASPRRVAMGVDSNRLALIMAVLEKKAGLQLQGLDVFVNVVGGLSIQEPAVDLALALAIYSSFRNLPLRPDVAIFGELGLAGEVRSVSQAGLRCKECRNLGLRKVICPKGNLGEVGVGLEGAGVATLVEALEQAV